MSYHQFIDDVGRLNVFEVFEKEDGFYWRMCWLGFLPDDDEFGPFATEEEAIRDTEDTL